MSLHTTSKRIEKYNNKIYNKMMDHGNLGWHYLKEANKLLHMETQFNLQMKELEWHYPKNYGKLWDKHEVELSLLIINREKEDRMYREYKKKKENLGKSFIEENSKIEKVSDKTKRQIEKESCSICFEHHKSKHIIRTSCNHYFGTYCFSKFIDSNFENNRDIVCPMCRNENISEFTRFG
jgi:hypothetical protein